jgi:hypothetical protein
LSRLRFFGATVSICTEDTITPTLAAWCHLQATKAFELPGDLALPYVGPAWGHLVRDVDPRFRPACVLSVHHDVSAQKPEEGPRVDRPTAVTSREISSVAPPIQTARLTPPFIMRARWSSSRM